MTRKNLNALFIEYCKALGLTIQQSHFDKEKKYITAVAGTVYLGHSDPRAGKYFAIIKNGENGTTSTSTEYGYVPMQRLYGYMEGAISIANQKGVWELLQMNKARFKDTTDGLSLEFIGWQIESADGQHRLPPGYSSFEILSTSAAECFMKCTPQPELWKMVGIKDGDIEDPTFVDHI